MNILTSEHLYHPARDLRLEKEIDRILALELLSIQSLEVYLDVLVGLIKEHETHKKIHTKRKLANFLNRSMIKLDFNSPARGMETRHLNYLNEINEYVHALRKLYTLGSGNPWDVVDAITDNIKYQISENNASNESLREFMRENFSMHPDHQCVDAGRNLEIRLAYPEIIVYVVRFWEDFELPVSSHLVSLIVCTGDLSKAPDEIFTGGRLRSIFTLDHHVRFEQIYLLNPLYKCTSMINSSISILKRDHPEFERLIESAVKLAIELKNTNMKTHDWIIPQGHLVLEGVKTCIARLHSAVDAAAGLPDSYAIKIVKNRFELVAFSLSAFFSSLSTRLNTKKYMIASLDKIIRNDGLYKLKQTPRTLEHAFKEENLTTILAGQLSCFYHDQKKSIAVQTEVPMGNGYADVVVTFEGNISAIIEGKLIQKPSQMHQKVIEGLSQLYNRYGDHNSILDTFGVELYLVLFAYDQNTNDLIKATRSAIAEFASGRKLDIQSHYENAEYFHFSFLDERKETGRSEKRRSIYILNCNMELEKKDEPSYRISHKPGK